MFKEDPVTLVTAEHVRTGKKYDAALIWTEDTTKTSFKVCLREMQNFDGKHEDIYVVWFSITLLLLSLFWLAVVITKRSIFKSKSLL